jgi:hypothetical protein
MPNKTSQEHPRTFTLTLMPDVGLLTSTEPVPPETNVVIRFSVEVGQLPVYNESYDVDTLAGELQQDKAKVLEAWSRRLLCAVESRARPGFSAALTRCLTDGMCCDYGHENGIDVSTAHEEIATPADRSPEQENL